MTKMPKLNDLQLILLATAAQREDGSILPPPDSLGDQAERIRKAVPALLRRKLIVEMPVTDRSRIWREEDQQAIGLAITDAGRTIIVAEESEEQAADMHVEEAPDTATTTTVSLPRAGSKLKMVIGLLQRDEGATLVELVEVTGWLSHTTRAALTGLRKKGYVIDKGKRDDVTCYRIGEIA